MYPTRPHQAKARQRGAALLVMMVIVVMGAAAALVGSLSTTAIKNARQEKTSVALAQAKEALIGYAATKTDYPLGNMPCPDTDDDGTSDAAGSTGCPQYIGRLPWKTLGLPDLRDAAGERLWYTLSRNIRRYDSVRPLNSDTTGTLNITGTNTANNLMAIVFAPGANISGQSRSATQTSLCATTGTTIAANRCASNYLEGSNANLSTEANPILGINPNPNYQTANASDTFNDQLISISYDQLFSLIEKRVGNEIKKILNAYYSAWGAFPFAAGAFPPGPSTSTFTGQSATYKGLLPINDQSYQPTWNADPVPSFSGMSCERRNGAATNSRWRCESSSNPGDNFTIPAGLTVTITGRLNNVGLGFWRPHNVNNVCEVRAKDSGGTDVLVSSLFAPNSVTVTNSLNSDGSANIVFRATGKAVGTTLEQIEFRDILSYNTDIKTNSDKDLCPITPATSPVIPTWLLNDSTYGNNWHQVAYYAVSPGYAPGGGNTCNPLPGMPPCLTVNGSNGGNNKRAVVVMTSGALTGQSRSASPLALCPTTGTTIPPNQCLSNYLESENATPADFIYENKTRTGTFNDQVIIVAP